MLWRFNTLFHRTSSRSCTGDPQQPIPEPTAHGNNSVAVQVTYFFHNGSGFSLIVARQRDDIGPLLAQRRISAAECCVDQVVYRVFFTASATSADLRNRSSIEP